MAQPPDEDARLLARLASPDATERWRATGVVVERFLDDVRRITSKSVRGLTFEEAKDATQGAFERFAARVVNKPFEAAKIWGVREYILVSARRMAIALVNAKEPGRAGRREVDFARLGDEHDRDIGDGEGGAEADVWSPPDESVAADDATAGEHRGLDTSWWDEQSLGPDAAEAPLESMSSPALAGSTSEVEVRASVLDELVVAAFNSLGLSERDRDLLRLASADHGYDDIGKLCGITVAYARKRNCELKQKLKARMLSLLCEYDSATANILRRRLGLTLDNEPSA